MRFMEVRMVRWIPLALALIGVATPDVEAQKGPALPEVLKSCGDYVAQYAEKLGAVGAEEQYTQYETSSGQMATPKRVNTDVVWVGLGDRGVMGFRDAFAIDNAPLRQRDDRLLSLFKTLTSSSVQQATALTDDSVRQYLSPNLHALDQPLIALAFLRKENQERSTFKLEGVKSMNGAQVATVKFNERGSERLVPSAEGGPAVGRFWIDVATGAVRQTELGLVGKAANVTVTVKYAADQATGLWLPAEMVQHFDISSGGSGESSNMGSGGGYGAHQALEGRATYTKLRQVPIDLSRVR
jgi:hypothetical protein